jgi:seryl-tRNA synthetase
VFLFIKERGAMLDIKFIRQNPETVQTIADQKGIKVCIPELLRSDETRRQSLKDAEELRQTKNQLSKHINELLQQGNRTESEGVKEKVNHINIQLSLVEADLSAADMHYNKLMLLVPNVISADTPIGLSDGDNVEVKRVGVPRSFDFEMKDHVTLGELHGIIDVPRGVKVAGSRNYYLKGMGVQLQRAVQQLTIDLLVSRGFILMDVPLMVRKEALVNTGFFPLGQDQTYGIANEDKWLVGTSEVPLVSYYSNEIVDVTAPIKLAAISVCFRSEVGSTSRDVRGLYRVHQFSKVEQVIICANDTAVSDNIFREIMQNAEDILQLLELPYRIMSVCSGDMSQKTYKQYDIEAWMPSRQAYGETHSSSIVLDFQARRSNIRYRDASGSLQYCHTLNNTAIAAPRILIPLLENHQNEDGSIRIPEALRKYMNGMEKINLEVGI